MEKREAPGRTRLAVVAAFVIGAVIELMKARGSWYFAERSDLGNVSATWLLFSLLGGMTARNAARGAIYGLVTVMAALSGFYLAEAWVLRDAWSDGLVSGLMQCFSGGRIWFVLGLLSGPVLGAVGGWLSQRGKATWGWAITGVLFALEPLVITAINRVPLPVLNIQWWYEWSAVSVLEIAAGVACLMVWVSKARHHRL